MSPAGSRAGCRGYPWSAPRSPWPRARVPRRLRTALGSGAELVVQMDPGLGHDPADIIRLIEAAGEADVAIASRWVDGASTGRRAALGRWMERRGSAYLRTRLGVQTRDLLSGLVVLPGGSAGRPDSAVDAAQRRATQPGADLRRRAGGPRRGRDPGADGRAREHARPAARAHCRGRWCVSGSARRLRRSRGAADESPVQGRGGRFARRPGPPASTRIGVD